MAAAKRPQRARKRQTGTGTAAALATPPIAARAASGENPVAESVATLLLVERALRQTEMDVCDLGALLDRPGSVVVLHAEARGFASAALRLLEGGFILPGRVQTVDVGYIRPDGHVRFTNDVDIRWRIVTMLREADGDDLEGEDELVLRARIANTARAGHPLLVIAETASIPPLLPMVADRVLHAGRLDASIVAETAVLIAGHDGAEVRSALAAASFDPARLTVADLSVAIRPGVSVDRMIAVLTHLAATAGDDKEEDGGGAVANVGGGAPEHGDLSASAKSLKGKARKGKESQLSGKSKATASAASDIILPDAPNGYRRLDVETLAGYGAARGWALDLKADLALWRAGSLPWDQLSSRLLLSGPPGTGKTTFARALCNSLNLPLHVTSVSTWLEASYLGDVIKQMSAAFATARHHAPSILFIDECDGIGKRQPQNQTHADYWNSLVNKLLELMDGAAKAEGVVIVGATNRPEAMDEALKRSGRWEKQIAIPLPDREALAGIFAHHLGEDAGVVVATASGATSSPATGATGKTATVLNATTALDALARRAVGRSGADIERLVREARGRARREGRDLTHADLEAGLAEGRPVRPHDLRYRMAVHEAGHALVRHVLKLGTEIGLSIEAASGGFAEAELDLEVVQSPDWLMALMAAHLAGRAAETIVFGDVTVGSGGPPSSDLAHATRLALSMELELGFGSTLPLLYRSTDSAELLLLREEPLAAAVHARLESAFALATRTIEADRACLLRLADVLTEAGSLNATEIAAVFAREGPGMSAHATTSNANDASAGSDADRRKDASARSAPKSATGDGEQVRSPRAPLPSPLPPERPG